MKKIWIIYLVLYSFHLKAQTNDATRACSLQKQQQLSQKVVPAIADIREEDYNVIYVKLDLNLDNQSTAMSGSAFTRARVTSPALSEYVFELIPEWTIDSIKINNQPVTVSTSGVVRTAQLATMLTAGQTFDVQIWYHGQPGPPYSGIRTQTNGFWNIPVTYTISEPYFANNWWPCKQSLKDKIDSSDMWLTIPQDLKAGSNGKLIQITPMPDNRNRYEWKNRNPIDYYLISLAVSKYIDYSYYVHFDNSSDSMLVQNYLYDHPNSLDVKDVIDSTGVTIRFYSDLIGRYPFWKEKYGHCITPLGGGMEHQTMTTLGDFNYMLVAHELAHQWFGDNVTIASWKDIWLAESFATYLAWRYMGYAKGDSVAFNDMLGIHASVMTDTGGSVYCTDTTSVSRIFSGRLSYNKGAAVIHTLRGGYFSDEAQFFLLLQTYQQVYKKSNASTQQFKQLAETIAGRNLDTFFNEWIYGEGYPTYSASWNQDSGKVMIKLQQQTSMPSSVSFFAGPLQVRFYGGTSDTTVTFDNNQNDQQFDFSWDKAVDSLEIDPGNFIINKVDTIRRDSSLVPLPPLGITHVQGPLFTVSPNPAGAYWRVEGLPLQCDMSLTDVSGRKIWEGTNSRSGSIEVSARNLSGGVYFLRVKKSGAMDQTIKLLK